jgi:hypothetical protein
MAILLVPALFFLLGISYNQNPEPFKVIGNHMLEEGKKLLRNMPVQEMAQPLKAAGTP